MPKIYAALETCDVFIAIGTSGMVYPAAGFVEFLHTRVRTIGVNPDPDAIAMFAEQRVGSATDEVPKLVKELLSDS